ncbi:putative GIY-YIG superfamily endonuclease [Chryseobacterium vietnamense]|nr:hypothetical protein [Chryseobacterium vietnamense]MDR6487417.1 putative GIY-YIG superfamily endonuclease [Chryseobacterium vietnamense]
MFSNIKNLTIHKALPQDIIYIFWCVLGVLSGNREAIGREKQIKAGSRQKKLNLINSINPDWKDLTGDIENIMDVF